MERESQGEEGQGEGGRRWCPASISALTPRGDGCCLPTRLFAWVFFPGPGNTLAPAPGKLEVPGSSCAWKQPSDKSPSFLALGLEACLMHLPKSPAGPCPSCSRGSITCMKTLPVLASCPSFALSTSPTGISWDCFPDKRLALESSSQSLRLGEPRLRSRCHENQTSRKSQDVLSM